MKITKDHRERLIYYLNEFYQHYPSEKHTIFHFVKYFKLRLKNNKDAWCSVSGDTGCLQGNTFLYGYKSSLNALYKSGKKFVKTRSIYNGEIINSMSEIIDTGKKDVYEIELENGKKVTATLDHIFFTKDMKEIRLKNIKVGTELLCMDDNRISRKEIIRRKQLSKRNKTTGKLVSIKKIGFNILDKKEYIRELYFIKNLSQKEISKKIKISLNCLQNYLKKWKWNRKIDGNGHKNWNKKEIKILKKHYYNSSKYILLKKLDFSWSAINSKAIKLGIKRNPKFRLAPTTKNRITQIEKVVMNILKKHNIKFKYNKQIKTLITYRRPDFLIGKLIIECDGHYFHQDKKAETKRDRELIALGYNILHFSGKKIINQPDVVERCILNAINKGKIY